MAHPLFKTNFIFLSPTQKFFVIYEKQADFFLRPFTHGDFVPSWWLYRATACSSFLSPFPPFRRRFRALGGLPRCFWILVFSEVFFATILHPDHSRNHTFGTSFPPKPTSCPQSLLFTLPLTGSSMHLSFLLEWLALFLKNQVHCYVISLKGSIRINNYM